jgi:hypothetical protein
MTEVIHVSQDESPPKGRAWVLLEKTSSGRYVGNGSAARSPNAIFRIFPPEDWDDAISEAVWWADSHGVPLVHVRGRETDA